MLVSCILKMMPLESALLPAFLGRAVHAGFLRSVEQLSPDAAQKLHESHIRKPFTVSPLWSPLATIEDGFMYLEKGAPCYLRITAITAETSLLLQKLTDSWLATPFPLANVPFQVREVVTHPGEHPQAAVLSYVELRERVTHKSPPKDITFRFLTPTTFRRSPSPDTLFSEDPYMLPYPLPHLIFGGLLSLWNTFAAETLPEELSLFIQDCVFLSRYDLHTELINFDGGRRGRVGGFVGECRYAIRDIEPSLQRCVGLLAAFAPFAGIGWRTTMGLGQCKTRW